MVISHDRAFLDAISTPLARPNIAVTSLAVYNKLRKHPALVSAITGNESGKGAVTRQQLAEYFEVPVEVIFALRPFPRLGS